jgi:single-stranded-DNA-specific exonuclease
MMTDSRSEAVRLASELDELNHERKEAQERAVKEVSGDFGDEPVIVAHGKWHEGIVGIIAGRLSEIYKKPAFALTYLEDGKVLKGSGRSFGDFSLSSALENCPEGLLLSGGGHAGACGLSIEAKRLDDFKKQMTDYYLSLGLKDQERYLATKSDIVLDKLDELSIELYDEICQLEPFGVGNEEPVFEFKGRVVAMRILKEKHLSITLTDGEHEIRLMSFYSPEEYFKVKTGVFVRAQFTLTKNEWHGRVSVEGLIISLEEIEQI